MHTRPPLAIPNSARSRADASNGVSQADSTRLVGPWAAVRAGYYLLVRRRVPISLVLFTLLLTTEGLLGIGWHRAGPRSDILFGAAVAFVLLGLGIRSWAAGTIRKNSELATSGAYSLCRHPLYLGSFLMIVGFCLGTQPQINLPLVAPLVVVLYICAIRSEERTLTRLFGDHWTEYAAATPRLIPNPLRTKIRWSRWSFDQWQSNREYQAVLGTLAGLAGMLVWYAFV